MIRPNHFNKRLAALATILGTLALLMNFGRCIAHSYAAPATFTISGNVQNDGSNLSGAIVTLGRTQTASTTTDASGNYSLTADAGGNYIISVYKSGVSFDPASQSFTNLQSNQIVNFQNGTPLCAPPPSGLVGWWKGENSLVDASGNGNTLSSANGAGFASGKAGQGFNLTAFGQYLYALDSPSLSAINQITLDAWVNPTFNATGAIISKWEESNRRSYALVLSGGRVNLNLSSNGSNGNVRDIYSIDPVVPVGVLSHVAATFDTSGQTAHLYVNGIEVANSGPGPSIPLIFDSLSSVRIGGIGDALGNQSNQFIGVIDEPQIYNRALSSSEIVALYTAGSAGVCPGNNGLNNGLVAWYAAEGNARDSSGNGNDAGMQNSVTNSTGGKIGQSFYFTPGSNGYVSTNLDVQPSAMPSTTWEAWVYPNGGQTIFGNDDGGWDRSVELTSGGYFRVFVGSPYGFWDVVPVNYNQWQHIAVVYTPSHVEFYKNGVGYGFGFGPLDIASSNKLRIGSSPIYGGSGFYYGYIDEIGIYNRALSSSEIQAIYNSGKGISTRGSINTPRGSNINTSLTNNLNLRFTTTTLPGTTVATTLTASQLPALPEDYTVPAGAPIYDIRTSAAYSGNITVTFQVPSVADAARCSRLRSLHFENGTWATNTLGAQGYNGTAQVCTVSQTVASLSPFVIAENTPSITWNNPADITYGTALSGTQLNATASVPGTFVYTPADGTVLSAGGGRVLTVDFTPTDSAYNSVSKNVIINVLKADQTITFGTLSDKTFGDADFTVSATGGSSGNAVTFGSQTSSVCSVTGNTVKILMAGGCTIRASQLGNGNYNDATPVDQSFTVNKATPAINWNKPADITYGTSLSGTQLNATTLVPGNFVYTPAAGAVLHSGSTQTLHVDFSPTDNTNYLAASQSVSLNVTKASLTISANDQTKSYRAANPLLAYTPSNFVNADTAGILSGSPNLSTAAVTLSSAGSYPITITQGSLTALDYNFTFVAGTLSVTKATPVITWGTPADITYGIALGNSQLNALATNPNDGTSVSGTFNYNPTSGTSLPAGISHALSTQFAPADTTNYNIPADKAVTINVVRASASASASGGIFTFDGNIHGGSGAATGGAGENLAATLTYSGTGSTNYGPTSTAPTNAGTYQVIAHTDGDANNIGADSAPAAIVINQASSVTSVSCNAGPHIYDGLALTPCTAHVSGEGGLNQALEVQYSNNTETGTASATASFAGDPNHSGSSDSKTFVIGAADSTTVVTCPSSQIYSGSALEPCTVSVSGPGGLHLTPTPTYANNLGVGTASASYDYAGDTNHHSSSGSRTFMIDKASATTIVTCPGHITYTGAALEPCTASVTGPALNQSLPVNYSNNTSAGLASASASYAGDANHAGADDSKDFTIDKALSVSTVTCSAGPFTYTAAAQTPCSAKVTGAGGLNQLLNVNYVDNINAGTATAKTSFSGDSNHDGSTDLKNFVIDKAPVTVTADNKSMIFGSATPPTFTATFSGFVGGQSAAGLGYVPAFNVQTLPLPGSLQSINSSTPVGTYAIVPSGLSSINYGFTYNSGLLTVAPWTITGFYQPIDMNTPSSFIWNAIKGGSTVPLKFNLYGGIPGPFTERRSVVDVMFGSVQIANISCNSSIGLESLVDNVTDTGNTSLRYDVTDSQFVQNWKTPKSPNMCYQVRVTALDGSHIDAYFKTK